MASSGTSNAPTLPSPTLEEIKKELFIALDVLNGYTESEARLNYACEQGTCKCPQKGSINVSYDAWTVLVVLILSVLFNQHYAACILLAKQIP